MADKKGSDQPPAYSGPSTNTSLHLYPCHTTKASKLIQKIKDGEFTTSQYLKLTFSIFVAGYEPVVLSIDEEYQALLDDFSRMFTKTTQIEVVWGKPFQDCTLRSFHQLGPGNTAAMLRLLKSRGGQDCLMIS